MNTMEIIALSIALGMDLFSVAIPIGMGRIRSRTIVQASLIFALFHIVMILVGYYLGHWTGNFLTGYGKEHMNWSMFQVHNMVSIVGAVVLIGLGLHILWENLLTDRPAEACSNPLKGISLYALAISVSIDALAAGLGMGMLDVNLVRLSIVLGIVIFCIAIAGLTLGRRISCAMGERCVLVGATVLVYLGGHLLWSILTV